MSSIVKVAIESPYAGNVERNVQFAKNVCRTACKEGYAPFVMHLMYTQFLDDQVPEERTMGINCGLEWTDLAEEVWFCLRTDDRRLSGGMMIALNRLKSMNCQYKAKFKIFTQGGVFVEPFITYDGHVGFEK